MRYFIKSIFNKHLNKKKVAPESILNKLIKNGLVVGENFNMMEGCIIDFSHCWHIRIGNNVTLAPRVHILAHDASTKMFLNYTKIKNVEIGNNVFIGANSIIMPGVKIGDNVVIGAGSLVIKDIASNSLCVGNPAKKVSTLDEYLEKEKSQMTNENVFNINYTLSQGITEEMKVEMIKAVQKSSVAFVE